MLSTVALSSTVLRYGELATMSSSDLSLRHMQVCSFACPLPTNSIWYDLGRLVRHPFPTSRFVVVLYMYKPKQVKLPWLFMGSQEINDNKRNTNYTPSTKDPHMQYNLRRKLTFSYKYSSLAGLAGPVGLGLG